MEFRLVNRYGFELTITTDNIKIDDIDVNYSHHKKDDEGKYLGIEYSEPSDEFTGETVSLLEDIAYYRHNNIEGTDTLIIELMRKKSETDVINLLRILNKEFGEEQD